MTWAFIGAAGVATVGGAALAPDPATIVSGAAAPGGTSTEGGGPFSLPLPAAATGGPSVAPAGGIDLSAIDKQLESLAQTLAATQQAPATVPLAPPNVGGDGVGPPEPGPNQGAANPAASIGEVLASSPEAIAAVANLLGLGGTEKGPDRPAPIPAGSQGAVIPGLQLPQTTNIGQLLSQIPRIG